VRTQRDDKFEKLLQKYQYESDPEEEGKKLDIEEKANTKIERSVLLYEKAKMKNKLLKEMYDKNNEIKKVEELKGCTFKPIINKSSNIGDKSESKGNSSNLYNRNMYWKSKNNEK
jgi:hypothetical protein